MQQRKSIDGDQKKTLADRGREIASKRSEDAGDAIEAAMREMERDIDNNGGIYPRDDGRITIQAVLRRAGKSATYLEKPRHKGKGGLKEKVATWVAQVNGRIARGAPTVRKMVTERIDEADARVKAIWQQWVEAALEYNQMRQDYQAKVAEIAELKAKVERLKAQLAGENVIPMKPTEKGKR